jgi:hypothetical protein
MPVPDFSPGEVWTAQAADSIGLWLVKTQTVGTGVSSVTVTGAFSADYDNYRVIVSGGSSVAAASISLVLGSANTGYYSAQLLTPYSADSISYLRDNNNVSFQFAGIASINGLSLDVDILNPFAVDKTGIVYKGRADYRTTGASSAMGSGFQDSATSFTGFTIATGTTMTGGTIRVYGYRN